MTESPAGEMIELHFRHQLGVERLPLHGMFRAPAAHSAGSLPGKSGRLDHFLQLSRQRQTLVGLNRRTEAHVIEQPLLVVKPQQQRADQRFFLQVPESAHHTIRGALLFYFLHAGAFASLVRQIFAFGHDSIEAHAHVEPFACLAQIVCNRRNLERAFWELQSLHERFKSLASLAEGQIYKAAASFINQ